MMNTEEKYLHDNMIRAICAVPVFREQQFYLLENVQLQDFTCKSSGILPEVVYREKRPRLQDCAVDFCICKGDNVLYWAFLKGSQEDKAPEKGPNYSMKSDLRNKYAPGMSVLSVRREFPVKDVLSCIGQSVELFISRDREDIDRPYRVVATPLSPEQQAEVTQTLGQYVAWNQELGSYAVTPYGAFCGLRMRWDASPDGTPVGTIVAGVEFSDSIAHTQAWARGCPPETDEFALFGKMEKGGNGFAT